MASTFKWVFEGTIPEGKSGDDLLEMAGVLRQQFPELRLNLVEFDNKSEQAVINLPKREALSWMQDLPWK